MFETHEEYDKLWRDEDMIEYGPETKYLSSPKNYGENSEKRQRVLAKYSKGVWEVECQVRVDSEWYVARRESLENPPSEGSEWRWNGRVRANYGAFTNLSIIKRIILSPFYAFWFFWMCISGKNVNIQILDQSDQYE